MKTKYIWVGICIFSFYTNNFCMKNRTKQPNSARESQPGTELFCGQDELEYFIGVLISMNTNERQNIRDYLSKIYSNEQYVCCYGQQKLAEFDNQLQTLILRSSNKKYKIPYSACILTLMGAIRIHSDAQSWSPEVKRAVKCIDEQFAAKLKQLDIQNTVEIAQGRAKDKQVPWCWLF